MQDEPRRRSHPRRDPWLLHGGRVPTGEIAPGARPAPDVGSAHRFFRPVVPAERAPGGAHTQLEVVSAGAGFYDRRIVGHWLGLSDTDLDARARLHRLLALECDDGSVVYPAWQFEGRGRVVAFLTDILQALAAGVDDPWTWALWLTARHDDGGTAVQTLRTGGDPRPVLLDAVRDAARWSH